MRHFFGFLFCFVAAFAGWGQILIEDQQLPAGTEQSEVFLWPDSLADFGFAALSAYTLDTQQVLNLAWRWREGDRWSAWEKLGPSGESPSPNRQAFAAKPRFEPFSAWQVRCQPAPLQPLLLRFFLAPKEKKELPQSTAQAQSSCHCPPPPLCRRSCWCPSGNCPPPASYTPTQPSHLIVHHSAGFSNYNDYKWVVSYYWDLHVNTNGWSDIGYNYLIDRNGVVYEGRGNAVVGAHFSCLNSATVGICLIGNFMQQLPEKTALERLRELGVWQSCLHGIAPNDSSLHSSSQLFLAHLSGHRDANSATVGCPSGTVCPGDVLYPQLDSLAQAMAQSQCLLSQVDPSQVRLAFYPNPVRDVIYWEKPEPSIEPWQLRDLQGRILQTWEVQGYSGSLPLSQWHPGLYWLQTPRATYPIRIL